MLGLATASFTFLLGAKLALIIVFSILSVGVTAFLSKKYQEHVSKAVAAYNSVEKIRNVINPTEKQALKDGLEAKNWSGYFWGFSNYAAYRERSAFNAAKQFATEENDPLIAEIKKIVCK